jgi:2-dehydropantoate 2-reductase
VLPAGPAAAGVRIAVFGAGGVGGYFGGRLAEAGESVAFVARGAQLEALRRDGLNVESIAGDFVVKPVEADDDPARIGPVDMVLVAVKAWQVQGAARAIGPLLRGDTIVLPLQNGVEAADQLAAVVGAERVLGGLCRIVAFLSGPGRIRHSGVPPRIEFAERDGRSSERVTRLRAVFERARGLAVSVPADIDAALWEKFLFIAPVSGVGAATRVPVGGFRALPESRVLLEGAMAEVFALARARGVRLPDDAVARALGYVDSLPAEATASMQRDIIEGRPSELEAQTGTIVRLGRAAAVPVPINEMIYGTLLPLERKARGVL